jgi:hypothetical protein
MKRIAVIGDYLPRQCGAGQLFDQALPATLEFTSPRAWAFALVAIREYLRRFEGDRAARNTGKCWQGD